MIPFEQQSAEVIKQFKSLASGSDRPVTAEELYEALVPERLMDNPPEVMAFIDGLKEAGVPPRDLSRIISGENGGEYTIDNVVFERMGPNRARQEQNIDSDRLEEIEIENAMDAETIDAAFDGDLVEGVVSSSAEAMALASEPAAEATGGLIEIIGEGLGDAVLPAIAEVSAAKVVSDQCTSDEDKIGYGALAAGGTALFAITPVGQALFGGYALFKLGQAAFKAVDHCNKRYT